jgi:hypothetical protein
MKASAPKYSQSEATAGTGRFADARRLAIRLSIIIEIRLRLP